MSTSSADRSNIIPNSFQTPNEYVDHALPLLSGDEIKVLLFAVRHILGWHDRIHARRAPISVSMFTNGFVTRDGKVYAGTGLSRPTVVRILNILSTYGLLLKVGAPTPEGQIYELYENIDWAGLEARYHQRKAAAADAATKKAAQARTGKRKRVPNKVVNGLYQSTPLTDGGKGCLPVVVNGLNSNKAISNTRQNQDSASGDADAHTGTPEPPSESKRSRRTKAVKDQPTPHAGEPPAQRQRDEMFDAVALHIFGFSDAKAEGGRVAKISNWLKGTHQGKGEQKVGFISSPANPTHVAAFAAWWSEKNPNADLPRDLVKFVEAWRSWASAMNHRAEERARLDQKRAAQRSTTVQFSPDELERRRAELAQAKARIG